MFHRHIHDRFRSIIDVNSQAWADLLLRSCQLILCIVLCSTQLVPLIYIPNLDRDRDVLLQYVRQYRKVYTLFHKFRKWTHHI